MNEKNEITNAFKDCKSRERNGNGFLSSVIALLVSAVIALFTTIEASQNDGARSAAFLIIAFGMAIFGGICATFAVGYFLEELRDIVSNSLETNVDQSTHIIPTVD